MKDTKSKDISPQAPLRVPLIAFVADRSTFYLDGKLYFNQIRKTDEDYRRENYELARQAEFGGTAKPRGRIKKAQIFAEAGIIQLQETDSTSDVDLTTEVWCRNDVAFTDAKVVINPTNRIRRYFSPRMSMFANFESDKLTYPIINDKIVRNIEPITGVPGTRLWNVTFMNHQHSPEVHADTDTVIRMGKNEIIASASYLDFPTIRPVRGDAVFSDESQARYIAAMSKNFGL